MQENKNLRKDVDTIINKLVLDINPYDSVCKNISNLKINSGKNILISIGKASWSMAKAITDNLAIDKGVVITKYGYSNGDIKNTKIFEAGHPIVDENSIKASEYVLDVTSNLNKDDNVILCLSGGGSALFEKPLISLEKLAKLNDELIKSGANITEINMIRKRLSGVKGGKFALHCAPAKISAIILSDVVGNNLSAIASGPVSVDNSNSEDALNIINKYSINIDDEIKDLLYKDTVKQINNVDNYIVGSVKKLCGYTRNALQDLGYEVEIIKDDCTLDVNEIADKLNKLASNIEHHKAYIIGGESVVKVTGTGMGGRNSHLALLCSKFIDDEDTCVFAFGSDGSDGPTDAAGGYVDINTKNIINVDEFLKNFDSYNGLLKTNGLIKTGPTGSNINDVYVLLRR